MEIRPASWDDLDAVYGLLVSRSLAVHGQTDWTPATARMHWDAAGFDVGVDNWVAVAGGKLVGYAAVSERQYVLVAGGDAPVSDALLGRAVARARERGFAALRALLSSEDEGLRELLARHGFARETEAVRMWKELNGAEPAPTLPPGVTLRTFEPEDAASVKGLLDNAYSAWDANYVVIPDAVWQRLMTEDAEFDPSVWWLAEEGGELVGCALHWRGGWVKDIAVRESHRGRGLGKALLLHAFAEFARRGVPRVGLKVDVGNPTGAVALYERLGFLVDRHEEIRTLWL